MTKATPEPHSTEALTFGLDEWAAALLGDSAAPMWSDSEAGCWTGSVEGTEVCLVVEPAGASPEIAARAVSFAERTGHALVTVLIDGGSARAAEGWSLIRSAHRLSGVLTQLTIETGRRSEFGRLRASASDWRAVVTVEPESSAPHFSSDEQTAGWARTLLSLVPANHAAPAPSTAPAEGHASGFTFANLDPAAVVAALSEVEPVVLVGSRSAAQIGFMRFGGHTVGYAASTVFTGDGELTSNDLASMTRLIDYCDANHLPFVAILDTPGLADGTDASALNQLARSLAETATPTVVVVTRRAGGLVGALLTDRALLTGEVLAWPNSLLDDPSRPGGLEADRVIDPEHTADEIATTLARWAAVDEPLPERRRAVRTS